MKVLALISGGKDSCFSLMLCQRHGHEIVALGNIAPDPALETEDLDSFMFQTVGHKIVALYAQCTGIPLYRAFTKGQSVEKGLSYRASPTDEVEDLYRLVSFVKSEIPQLEAVCSGAIASDYQRLRVENVCSRLGLISLSYLWRQPQLALLEDMISSGIEAVLVKVAAVGLDPDLHLGKSISEMKPYLIGLRDRFGCNVCGEGGEYETVVLDCPAFALGRIRLDSWEIHKEGGDISPVGTLSIRSCSVVAKGVTSLETARVTEVPPEYCRSSETTELEFPELDGVGVTSFSAACGLFSSYGLEIEEPIPQGLTPDDGLGALLTRLGELMERDGVRFEDVVLVHLFVKDMGTFDLINRVYSQFFPKVDSPSRACIEVRVAAPCSLQVLVSTTGRDRRSTLHVQSMSLWAPCCIGPYSQATSIGSLSFVSGQLGLDPATMTFRQGLSWREELVAVLSHCRSVSTAVGANFGRSAIKMNVFVSEECRSEISGLGQIMDAISEWKEGLNGEADVDDYLREPKFATSIDLMVSIIVVPRLPKGARIEIQPVVLNKKGSASSSEDATPMARLDSAVRLDNWIQKEYRDGASELVDRVDFEKGRKLKGSSMQLSSGSKLFRLAINGYNVEAELQSVLDKLGVSEESVVSGIVWYDVKAGDAGISQQRRRTEVPLLWIPCLGLRTESMDSCFAIVEFVT